MVKWVLTARHDSPHASSKTLHLFLVLSVGIHCLALLILEKAVTPADRPAVTAYRVELVPFQQVDDAQSSERAEMDREGSSSQEQPLYEDTISLDTRDDRYAAYAKAVKERIWGRWRYPDAAVEKGLEGQVEILFAIGKDGRLAGIKPVKSSGHSILDAEVQESVRRAGPFPPLPSSMRLSRLNVHATFIYSLKQH